ncbi:hypothetical protein [Methyloceanibacter caenitepidi]|uniref:Uncharacterized protein n=1 Tax=Methyloceanibacter caenitepidi TaxID=1384459 RepID=A0A0A8K018_9HYPH|nr:hypothetical protein [Methyloceanibacter caenitepidi]BAQ16101.1 hypothetical protein GL4_0638 [Methyloceanibacter caenitepidi]
MSSFDVVEVALGSAVAQSGTIVIDYPENRYSGSYVGYGHKIYAEGLQRHFTQDGGEISVAFTTSITITYNGATSIPANTAVMVELNRAGDDRADILAGLPGGVTPMLPYLIDLGTPDMLDAGGICEAQSDTGAHDLTINGDLASGGVVVLDVPRNVIADSGGADTAVLTVYGEDVYGQPMAESITLNGSTAVPGKKAFKKITRVAASATISNGAFLGTGDVIGLPVFLPYNTAGLVIGDFENGTFDASLDGTLTAGVQTTPTATTGDVRGTYDPGATLDGATAIQLAVFLADPTYKGVNQYAG